jgi:hypothetical protein
MITMERKAEAFYLKNARPSAFSKFMIARLQQEQMHGVGISRRGGTIPCN